MKHIEDELRKALVEVTPPEGLAERVLARVAERERERHTARPRGIGWPNWFAWSGTPGLRWALAGALCAALVVGGVSYRRARTRERGERAKDQLMLALRITASELHAAQATVREINYSNDAER